MRYLLLIILFVLYAAPVPAGEPVLYDKAVLKAREFSSRDMEVYKADRRFQYEKVYEPATSWIQRVIDWIKWNIARLFSTKQGQYTFNLVLLLLAVAIIVFFIIKLTGMSPGSLFGKKNKGEKWAYSANEENIHTIDFEEAIRQAKASADFRLAVRLLYLQALKKLADRGLIQWQIDKTNIAYVKELGGTAYQQHFGSLTLQFENNWYGDLPINEKEFSTVNEQFSHFNRQLK